MMTVNIAIIGLGYWGPNILRSFNRVPDTNIKYICDLDLKKLEKLKPLYPKAVFTDKIDDILKDESVQAVAIATSAKTHFDLAKKAFDAGKHVFVEKPLTLSCPSAQELIDLAELNNKKLMIGHLLLYHPAVNFLKQYIEDGKLGDIRYIYSSRINLGKVRQEENAFWSLAPHDLSVILYLLGQDPINVSARGESYLRKGIEDVVFCYLKFQDDIMAHIHVSWLDPHKVRKLTIVGTEKMAVFNDMDPTEKIRIYEKNVKTHEMYDFYDDEYLSIQTGDVIIPKLQNIEPLYAECKDFIDCILNDTQPRSNGEEGLSVLSVLEKVEGILKKERAL